MAQMHLAAGKNRTSKCSNYYDWSRCVNRHPKCTLMRSVALVSTIYNGFFSSLVDLVAFEHKLQLH